MLSFALSLSVSAIVYLTIYLPPPSAIRTVPKGAIYVKWLANTNQILCTTSGGSTKVLFDPRLSVKGAVLTAGRAAKREKDPTVEVVGEIFNPHALPMFRKEEGMNNITIMNLCCWYSKSLMPPPACLVPGMHPKRGKQWEKKLEAMKATVPERPAKSGPGHYHLCFNRLNCYRIPVTFSIGTRENQSFFFTQHVMEGREVQTTREDDPRTALLKFDAQAKADPIFYGGAYGATQPKQQLHTMTFEEEQDEFKKRQKRSLDI